MSSEFPIIGIDLGGTKIGTALVDHTGNILAYDYRPTRAEEGHESVIRRLLDAATQVLDQSGRTPSQVAAVGIGAPGPVDIPAGVVAAPPNLPGWHNVPLRQRIQDELGVTTFLENDANAAALGELQFGAGRGCRHMIYVTVSTGIGGGLILDGRIYHGASGMAGEIGHTTVVPDGPPCGCGQPGHLEAYASGTAIARRGREALAQGVPSQIAQLAEGDPERVTAKLVGEAAALGDEEAQRILDEGMDYLGIAMADLVNLLNPEMIVIGGGLANLGERLFGPVRRAIDQRAFEATAQDVQVVPAALGDKVGVLGAAAVAMAHLQGQRD